MVVLAATQHHLSEKSSGSQLGSQNFAVKISTESKSSSHSKSTQWDFTDGDDLNEVDPEQSFRTSRTSRTLGLPPSDDRSFVAEARRRIHMLMSSWQFDTAIGVVILANSVGIGVSQSYKLDGYSTSMLDSMEHVYLIIYAVELALRFFATGRFCLKDNWVKFDCALVVTGIATGYILEPILGQVEGIEVFMVLRTVRMMRLARMVRLVVKFRVLWMLVRGLLGSAGTMFYTLLMLFVIVYVFSSIGIELVTFHPLAVGSEADPEFQEIVDVYFRSLPITMLTLVQFVCLDSVASIYKPLIEMDMRMGYGFLLVYFMCIILIIPIVLMNIVTAVVVNGALQQAEQDKDAKASQLKQKQERRFKELRQVFIRLDEDGSGTVTIDEIRKIDPEDREKLCQLTSMANPEEIFHSLDADESGVIHVDEFCHGIWTAAISKVPIEVQRMDKKINLMFKEMHRMASVQGSISDVLKRSPTGGARSSKPPTSVDMIRQSSPSSVTTGISQSATEDTANERLAIEKVLSQPASYTFQTSPTLLDRKFLSQDQKFLSLGGISEDLDRESYLCSQLRAANDIMLQVLASRPDVENTAAAGNNGSASIVTPSGQFKVASLQFKVANPSTASSDSSPLRDLKSACVQLADHAQELVTDCAPNRESCGEGLQLAWRREHSFGDPAMKSPPEPCKLAFFGLSNGPPRSSRPSFLATSAETEKEI